MRDKGRNSNLKNVSRICKSETIVCADIVLSIYNALKSLQQGNSEPPITKKYTDDNQEILVFCSKTA